MESKKANYFGYATNHVFLVEFDSEKTVQIGFSKVSNIQRSVEYDSVAEGGVNDRVHVLVKPASQAQTIIFEKGIRIGEQGGSDGINMTPGTLLKKPVSISVYADSVNNGAQKEQRPARQYRINGGVVAKWELGNLDSMGSEVLVERFEILHNGIEEVKQR